jgi:hypothetical protein
MEPKDNSGALFKNDRRETEKQPYYTGDIRVAGIDYRISAWLNESQKGVRYMGLRVTPKDDVPSKNQQSAPPDDPDDDFPF